MHLTASIHRMVPVVGLEPTRPCGQQILSLSRLPFRHTGNMNIIAQAEGFVKDFFFWGRAIAFESLVMQNLPLPLIPSPRGGGF